MHTPGSKDREEGKLLACPSWSHEPLHNFIGMEIKKGLTDMKTFQKIQKGVRNVEKEIFGAKEMIHILSSNIKNRTKF